MSQFDFSNDFNGEIEDLTGKTARDIEKNACCFRAGYVPTLENPKKS